MLYIMLYISTSTKSCSRSVATIVYMSFYLAMATAFNIFHLYSVFTNDPMSPAYCNTGHGNFSLMLHFILSCDAGMLAQRTIRTSNNSTTKCLMPFHRGHCLSSA